MTFIKCILVKHIVVKYSVAKYILVKYIVVKHIVVKYSGVKYILVKHIVVKYSVAKYILVKYIVAKYSLAFTPEGGGGKYGNDEVTDMMAVCMWLVVHGVSQPPQLFVAHDMCSVSSERACSHLWWCFLVLLSGQIVNKNT